MIPQAALDLQREAQKTKPKCYKCGSEKVFLDAWAEWDNEKQDWVLGLTFDAAFCENCDGETKLTWITQDA